MAGTRPESDDGEMVTSLVEGLRADRMTDTRPCPHDTCDGDLRLFEIGGEETPLCSTCFCTPDGTFYPPPMRVDRVDPHAPLRSWVRGEDRDEYEQTGRTRLAGGYEDVYNANEENRPDGVSTDYTFDLSTLCK